MFSGKTEELLRRIRRAKIARQKVQIFKPRIDTRSLEVQSHDSHSVAAQIVDHALEISVWPETRIVAIDEVQFFDDAIVSVVSQLADKGHEVIVAGLDLDYRGNPFGPMPLLLAVAEVVTKLCAICVQCGQTASRTQRLTPDKDVIAIGASQMYEARCRFCHEKRYELCRTMTSYQP